MWLSMKKLSVFDSFNESLSLCHEEFLAIPFEAEDALEAFIKGLSAHDFPQEVPTSGLCSSQENENANTFVLLCSRMDAYGAYYTIKNVALQRPVAICVVANSLLKQPFDADIVSEIQEGFMRSYLQGQIYRLSEEDREPCLQSEPMELIKNVSFLGQAVDIVKLDPANIVNSLSPCGVVDYSFTEATAVASPDGRFGIPPGTKIFPKHTADVAINTSIFDEKTSFSSNFSATVTVHLPPPMMGMAPGSTSKEIRVERKHLFPSYSAKLPDIVKKAKRFAKILINKMTYTNIWRNQAKSQILTEGDVRLDLQGFDADKFNYQIQVGAHTIAAVLIDRAISEIKIPSEQTYALRRIKSGFQQSLDDSHIYHVGFKHAYALGMCMEEDMDEDPMSTVIGEAASNASAFSGSMTFDFVRKNTCACKNTVTHSTATHTLYTLKQDIGYDPKNLKLDSEFCFWIEKKLDIHKPASLQSFIKEVGTHYTTSVTYGGVGFQFLKISVEDIEKLQEKNISIEVAAAEVLLKSKTSTSTEQGYTFYSESLSAQTVFLGGTVLPEISKDQLDFKSWSESIPQEPVPLEISVSPITELITPEYFPSMNPQVLAKTKSALGKAILEYLKENTPNIDKPKDKIFTTGYHWSASQFILCSEKAPLVVSDPYKSTWSTLPYLFPTVKEASGAQPLVFYFLLGNLRTHQNVLHNSAYSLCCLSSRFGNYGKEFIQYDALSFYGSWEEGYLDMPEYTDRSAWVIEKLDLTKDLFIRDGDAVRFKHVSSGGYLSAIAMKDCHQTITRTTVAGDAVFIIKRPSVCL